MQQTDKPSIFTKIIRGEIPAEKLYETDDLIVIRDIQPQAPFHVLVIPKKEVVTLPDLAVEDELLVGRIFSAIRELAHQFGLESGYRVVVNCGVDGGQTVPHLHFHMLGRKKMEEQGL